MQYACEFLKIIKRNISLEMKEGNAAIASHYGEDYFNHYQKEMGEFGGRANKFMFEKHILPGDVVLDFGCGGGFLLNNLTCHEKIGVEINPIARDYCNQMMGIKCYESLEFIPNESLDVVISSHCLEHTTNPFELVSILFQKLKNTGKIIIVVPLESYKYSWAPQDVNNHLYSFSPMNLGNILQGVGFTEIKTEVILHKWIRGYKKIDKIFGLNTFHQLSWLYGKFLNLRCVQVKGYGIKSKR
jgi:SAM-dependent methyltransferase